MFGFNFRQTQGLYASKAALIQAAKLPPRVGLLIPVRYSFLVQATDKTGNPVTMFLSPNSMTEISTDDSGGQNARTGTGGMFTSVPAKEDLSSKVVGLDVYSNANQDIGKIKDIAFNANGVKAYIVGVGGFLGMGDHYVAVRPSAIKLSYNASEKQWHAAMDTNADQLKSAPARVAR